MAATTTLPSGARTVWGDGGTTYWVNQDRRMRDVSNKIFLLDPDQYQLTLMLRRLRRKKAKDPKIEWFEDDFQAQTDTTAGTMASGGTAFLPTTAALYRPWDLWYNAIEDEVVYVTGVATNITVIRDVGNKHTTDPAWGSGDTLFYIGNANPVASAAREMLTTQTETKYNYVQLFKEGFEIGNTLDWTSLYGGKDLMWLRYKHGILHQRDMERSAWVGRREEYGAAATGISTHQAVFATGGVMSFIDGTHGTGNTTDFSGTVTADEYDEFLATAFRYGNTVKFQFNAPIVSSEIAKWGRDDLQTVPSDQTWGINIKRYISPHGDVNMINTKLFQDLGHASASLKYQYLAVLLDMESLFCHVGRDTHLEMNIQDKGKDSKKDQYLTELGISVKQSMKHSYMENFYT